MGTAGTERGYPEPFGLLEPPAQNVGCCCHTVPERFSGFPPKTSGLPLDPPWNPLDPPQTPLDPLNPPTTPLILAFSGFAFFAPTRLHFHEPLPGSPWTRPTQPWTPGPPCPPSNPAFAACLKFGLRFMRGFPKISWTRLRLPCLHVVDILAPEPPGLACAWPLLNSFC